MDHSHMDHGGMGHGDMGHGGGGGGGGMDDMCNMNMLFTWDTNNLCIVFKQWHVRGPVSLIFSLLGVVLICAGYEALRDFIRRYEASAARRADGLPRHRQVSVEKRSHVVKAALYAVQTFYAFMIMLLFMTYNGWVMVAVAVGAFAGYLVFGKSTCATKETACH
ncbi:ctr copper transporter [Apiospora marii]|uniref:Copper transport protein n=1 Tax=Apiospora marii TaxID=335849 RepID=A0ABR1S860_9PEZI